jgi:hypothetical protein
MCSIIPKETYDRIMANAPKTGDKVYVFQHDPARKPSIDEAAILRVIEKAIRRSPNCFASLKRNAR